MAWNGPDLEQRVNPILRHVDLAAVHELDEQDGVFERGVLQADDELARVEVGIAATAAGAGGGERQEEVLEVGRARGEHHLK